MAAKCPVCGAPMENNSCGYCGYKEETLSLIHISVLAHMVGRSAAGDDRGENFYDQRETCLLYTSRGFPALRGL